jgi:hypothetical protein
VGLDCGTRRSPAQPLTTLVEFGELGAGKGVTLSVPGGFIKEGQKTRFRRPPAPSCRSWGRWTTSSAIRMGAPSRPPRRLSLLYLRDLAS